jgi:hypothetical protein
MNEVVYQQLWSMGLTPPWARDSILRMKLPTTLLASDGTRFDFGLGAHSPGASTLTISDASGNAIHYPGDLCLQNAYYSLRGSDILRAIQESPGHKHVLIDAAFLGHEPQASEIDAIEALESILESTKIDGRSAVITAETPDYLHNFYIWHFQRYYTGPKSAIERRILADPSLIALLETTFEAFITRRHSGYDPFMHSVLGSGMSNYLESVRLYPLDEIADITSLPSPLDVFCRCDQLEVIAGMMPRDTTIYVVGRLRGALQATVDVYVAEGRRVVLLDGADFSFHSRPEDVISLVLRARQHAIHPILFHNYAKRIRKALKNQLMDDDYSVLTRKPIELAAPSVDRD